MKIVTGVHNTGGAGLRGRKFLITFVICCTPLLILKVHAINPAIDVTLKARTVPQANVAVTGFLGDALHSSEEGRLKELPHWDDGTLIRIFSEASKKDNERTDWYGEHAGKWLIAASMAAARTGDPQLKELLLATADKLVSDQEADGYLGTYSKVQRLTNGGARHNHSWDVWNLSYMTLGLLKLNEYFPDDRYEQAAKAIGELFLRIFGDGSHPVPRYGTRHGISATVLLDPVVELYRQTGDGRYLGLAQLIVKEMDEAEGLGLLSVALRGRDLVNVGDGKAYQIIWNLTAITKLYVVTGDERYLKAAMNAWKNIVNYHLTICGGPWGGVGKFYECFNRAGFWSPYGFTETCSSMAWIQFNKALFEITGDPRYAQEIEKTTYNALAGSLYPDGVQWCYHSFVNGCRYHANFNDCCPSSGALALEEIPGILYSAMEDGVSCNIYAPGKATVKIQGGARIGLNQETGYPFDGRIHLTVSTDRPHTFPLFVRVPDWADEFALRINGEEVDCSGFKSGTYFRMDREWKNGDRVEIEFPMELRTTEHPEFVTAPQSRKDIYRVRWFALSRGPLVYAANGLIDETDREGVFPMSGQDPEQLFEPVEAPEGTRGPAYELDVRDRDPLLFLPYYEAGGRSDGTWRLTWIQESINR